MYRAAVTSAQDRPARLTVGVVGAGRVGSVLGAALAAAGHRVTGVSAVSDASLERAARLLPGIPVKEIPDVVAGAELVLLAVPDDALAALVAGLSATRAWQAGQIVVHTSGLHALEVFAPALDQHVLPLALHPAMTFTGTSLDLDRLRECCFGVTAPEQLRAVAEALVLEVGAEPVWIAESDRGAYHLALAHGANHLVTLVSQALDILASTGVDQPDRVLGPLVRAALDNALRGRDAALTGPVARGDLGTVERHVSIAADQPPDVRPAYVAMALATVERAARDRRLREDQARPIAEFLREQQ
ncbi:conserved hypothetical protein [Nostocoides japonicum T1-X7]|uniref:Uncharacterized protein n=1 Tax=Nostocoides japonicum T1-X7 TaxID=1194083 RepID=A0A077M8Q6_9MICO|nr:DUF2520 domain-containing protein [Tetrasphaera japonica]CCH80405.1 conserved hypothetical protein [Tetrasphaera japonica T1-X7]